MTNLWQHQLKAVNEIEQSWKEGIASICYQLSTGGGKTRIIRTIVNNHSKSKKVIYIIAHRKNLVKQLSREIDDEGIRHGLISSGNPYIKYRVQVASLQTLVRRIDRLPEPEIIIIDEFHHAKNNSYMKIINRWNDAHILGMTATPARLDGKPLSDVCQKLIIGPPMSYLIKNDFLSDYEYKSVGDVDLTGVKIQGGDYNKKELFKKVIFGDIVYHYKKYSDHKPAIASCINIIHAEKVAQEFRLAGYKAVAIHSKMGNIDISNAICGLRSGMVEILCQCELLGEGIDIPGATTLIGLRPTASLVIFLQHIGRVLRKSPGKEKAIILDHVGNWKRHGLPDDDRKWTLEGKIKQEKSELIYKRCPECLQVVMKTASKCQFCGHEWTRQRERELPEIVEAELIDVKKIKRANAVNLIKYYAKNVSEACRIASKNGYKSKYGYYIWTKILKRS